MYTKPLHCTSHSKSSSCGFSLELALKWFLEILFREIPENGVCWTVSSLIAGSKFLKLVFCC